MSDSTYPQDERIPSTEPIFGPDPPRRSFFFKFVTALVGLASAIAAPAAGLWTFSTPLTKKAKAGGKGDNGGTTTAAGDEGFVAVGPVTAVPTDGSPHFFNIIADKTDAWTLHRNVPIGSVYVRRTAAGTFEAFNAACPHLGCMVSAKQDGSFACPCHDSEFNKDGTKKEFTSKGPKTVALRGMDPLDVKVREQDQVVMVKFQNYRAGIAERTPT